MKKFLRIVYDANSRNEFVAYEYHSDIYLNRNFQLQNIIWMSAPETPEQIIGELRARGWHPTDIADALEEARRWIER